MRGEKVLSHAPANIVVGSSPLARGKDAPHPRRMHAAGIIPACAGKSIKPASAVWCCKDHPRLRGEKSFQSKQAKFLIGSSPLARGKVEDNPGLSAKTRIIPACAGKSWRERHERTEIEDHPRLRGEKVRMQMCGIRSYGSSPLARGKGLVDYHPVPVRGIIPACAGKSFPSVASAHSAADHPRLRGEKSGKKSKTFWGCGSSPLARGKGTFWPAGTTTGGIIPACAGKSGLRKPRHKRNRDHPRLRGEKGGLSRYSSGKRGSSPLARGKGGARSSSAKVRGIIPACAGKSVSLLSTACCPSDHPRLRGEKTPSKGVCKRNVGSSPLARGKGQSCRE